VTGSSPGGHSETIGIDSHLLNFGPGLKRATIFPQNEQCFPSFALRIPLSFRFLLFHLVFECLLASV
jgi:hypothetical protein